MPPLSEEVRWYRAQRAGGVKEEIAFGDGVQVAWNIAILAFTLIYVAGKNLPNLTLLRRPHDHTGNFSTAINGVDTPELKLVNNDYAVGLVASAVAHSPDAKNTLIFVIEDDAQDSADHVDAHRSNAFVIGPYVKQHAVVRNATTPLTWSEAFNRGNVYTQNLPRFSLPYAISVSGVTGLASNQFKLGVGNSFSYIDKLT